MWGYPSTNGLCDGNGYRPVLDDCARALVVIPFWQLLPRMASPNWVALVCHFSGRCADPGCGLLPLDKIDGGLT